MMSEDALIDPADLAASLHAKVRAAATQVAPSPQEGLVLTRAFTDIGCPRSRAYLIALASALAEASRSTRLAS